MEICGSEEQKLYPIWYRRSLWSQRIGEVFSVAGVLDQLTHELILDERKEEKMVNEDMNENGCAISCEQFTKTVVVGRRELKV